MSALFYRKKKDGKLQPIAESKPKRGTSVDVECSLRANVRAARAHLFRSCRHQFFPFIRFLESALFLSPACRTQEFAIWIDDEAF